MNAPFAKLQDRKGEAADQRRRAFAQHREDVLDLFRAKWGRRLAWTWFEKAAVPTGQPHSANAPDALRTAFNCGKQDLAQQLWAEAWEHCPELLILMEKENRGGDS